LVMVAPKYYLPYITISYVVWQPFFQVSLSENSNVFCNSLNLKPIDKTDSLDILQLQKVINSLLVGGMINVGAIKKSYCGACHTQHAKRFFDFIDKEYSFYLCFIASNMVVIKENNNYSNLSPKEFIKAISTS